MIKYLYIINKIYIDNDKVEEKDERSFPQGEKPDQSKSIPFIVQGEILIKACTKSLKNQNQILSKVIYPFLITNQKSTK